MVETSIPEINLNTPPLSDNKAAQESNAGEIQLKEPNLKEKGFWQRRKKLLIPLFIVFSLFVVNFLLFFNVYLKTKSFYTSLKELKASIITKDLDKTNRSLVDSQKKFSDLKGAYNLIKWTRFVPFFGGYTSDFDHLLNAGEYSFQALSEGIEALGPHLDLLGFTGSSLGKETGATVDKIAFITKALPEVLPKIGPVVQKLSLVRSEIDQINPNRYPVRFGRTEIRSKVESLLEEVDRAISVVENSEPLVQQLPYILGIDSSRRYFLLFQNDKELRPTGGFMTAYAIMNVDKATFDPVSSDDIYNLDSKYKPSITAPDPIVKYLKGPYAISKKTRLRDLNWSPDFYESMKVFTTEIEKVGIEDIDGVIAVDTQFLVDLLEVLGPIQVAGYGTFSTEITPECNCPQVIYELESLADVEGPIVWDPSGSGKVIYAPPNWLNRKKMIGPLMNSIAAYSLGQPASKMPDLVSVFLKSLEEKHILVYFKDNKVQEAADKFGITGRFLESKGDYLYINDANLGGRKSNLYVTQEVNQDVTVSEDGYLEKKLVISYKNPEKQDGWLNSVLPNWVRIYVPKGSQLLSLDGLKDTTDPYEEAGKTVFAGFFELRPQGIARVEVKYRLPFKLDGKYNLLIQKQPGKDAPLYTLIFGKRNKEFYLNKDTSISF
jgi:hypothetical protein